MARLSRHLRSRALRLSSVAHERRDAIESYWVFQACNRLREQEVQLLSEALRREEHISGDVFPQLEHSPEEREAIAAFFRAYEAVRETWGA